MAFKTSNSDSINISDTRGLVTITDLDATTIATLKPALTYDDNEPTKFITRQQFAQIANLIA
jgi:hypothetical protein